MAHIHVSGDSSPPLRILSLDGGGIRGMSSLLILENIMEGIRKEEGLDRVPKPCEYFDFIGGTSTGGITAVMLGRLGMTVDECIRSYDTVARAAFTKKWARSRLSSESIYSATALRSAIIQIVKEFCTQDDCVARRSQGHSSVEKCEHSDLPFRDGSCTKTAVLAITRQNVDAGPTILSTYNDSARFEGCSIWEVCRATSAATTFFKPIRLGRDNIEFIDAGFGYNNPCDVLIDEAMRQFPNHGQLQVLSIGTGLDFVVPVEDSWPSILGALKKMATSSNQVAISLHKRYGDDGRYFRFNVDQGLENTRLGDWDKMSEISTHTHNYLNNNQQSIDRFVKGIVRSQGAQSEVPSGSNEGHRIRAFFYVPFPKNKRFVGRSSVLNELEQKLFKDQCSKVALVGLGGIGKTQVALQFAYWVKEKKPEYSVFWVPALSNASFEQAYGEIAKKLSIRKTSDDEDIRIAVRDHLSSDKSGKWLLIIDNADDMGLLFDSPGVSTGVYQYLPRSDNGVTLFTTRFREVAQSCAESDIIELAEMDPEEAVSFFGKSFDHKSSRYDESEAKDLVRELAYLPLAIKQAAAYLNTKKLPIAEYLSLLRNTEQGMTDLMSQGFQDDARYRGSVNAVATTWLVSFNQIRESDDKAAVLLEYISCLEPKAIPQSILPKFQTESQLVDAIGTLCAYAFLIRRDDTHTFDMHRLVHLGARIWVRRFNRTEEIVIKTCLHLREIFPRSTDDADEELWHAYAPHALKVVYDSRGHRSRETYSLSYLVGHWLTHDFRVNESIPILEEAYQWARAQLPEDDHLRLNLGRALSWAYLHNCQYIKAVEICEHVVEIKQKILPEDHYNRLESERGLAEMYFHHREYSKATDILHRIIPILTTLGNNEYLLSAEGTLADVYRRDGKSKEAIEILERIVKSRAKTHPQDNYDRLLSESGLSTAYIIANRIEEAISRLEHVVMVSRKIYSQDHSFRLSSEGKLGVAYSKAERNKKAFSLLEHVAAVRKALPEDNPRRLVPEYELAQAYLDGNRIEEAIKLLEHVTEVKKRTLEEGDRDRLVSEHELARAYLADNRIKEAIELLEHVTEVDKRTLEESNQSRLTSEYVLARAYLDDNRIEEAIELLEHVTEVEKRTLEESNQSRLASEYELAKAYLDDNRIEEAIELLEHVTEVDKRT